MKDWDKDYETPLGEYPGCIGYTWDGEFYPFSEINLLEDFDWSAYRELAGHRGGDDRRLSVILPTGPLTIEFGVYADIAEIMDQLPMVTVYVVHSDSGLPDGARASGSGYVFFLAAGASLADLHTSITALRVALDKDLKLLSANAPAR
jgi:hypothetical protein